MHDVYKTSPIVYRSFARDTLNHFCMYVGIGALYGVHKSSVYKQVNFKKENRDHKKLLILFK